jgi:hypothetical protein
MQSTPLWSVRLRRSWAPAVAAVLTLVPLPPATAGDITLTGSLSERLETNTNRDLDDHARPIYGSTTRLGFEFGTRTPTSTLTLEAAVAAAAFGGPGNTRGLNRVNPDFGAGYTYDGKYLDIDTDFQLHFQPASFAQLDETGITSGDATQITGLLTTDVAYAIDPRNRIKLTGSGRLVRFTNGTTSLTPTTTIGLSAAWTRDVTPRTSFTTTFGGRRFTADDNSGDKSLTFDLRQGLSHRVNKRLSFDAALGASATENNTDSSGGYNFGVVGDFEVSWQPMADTSVAFSLHQGVEPSDVGALRNQTSLGLTFVRSVNSWTKLGLDLAWRRRTEIGGGTAAGDGGELFRIGPTMDFELARNWQLGVGYTFVRSSENGSAAVANIGFLTLTRKFDFLH